MLSDCECVNTNMKVTVHNALLLWEQVDILISKNQALQILYLKHVYIKQHNLNYHG